MTEPKGYRETNTWKELSSQPGVWRNWSRALQANIDDLRAWIQGVGASEIWLSGAGTSAYIGDLVASDVDGRIEVPVRSMASTDIVARPEMLRGRNPLVVSFGRSGNSAESIGVMDALDALVPHAARLNITCNANSALAHRAGPSGRALILPEETHDAGFAMTASYSTMLLTALSCLDPEVGDVVARFDGLAQRAETLISQYEACANDMRPPNRIVFVGNGPLQFAAREAALKVMELTAGDVPALWDSTLGFRHGPKSFVTEGTDIVHFQSSSLHAALYDADLAGELAQQFPGSRLITVGPDAEFDTGAGPDAWSAVLYVIFAQVLGVVWSDALGYAPDNPFEGRGTLTRVVSGVTLYDPAGLA